MHRSFPKRLGSLGTILLLLGLLAGCGGKPTPPQTGANSDPKPAQELVIAQGTDPQTLDPHRSTVQQALNISMAIAEPLVALDYKTGEIKPVLATEIKLINPTTWQAKLRQGVKFTNGEEFTAAAVKFSIERIKKPELKSPAVDYVEPIAKVDVVDNYTVNIVTTNPSPLIPLYMTKIGMVPPKYVQEKGDDILAKAPVGTGPLKLADWVKDERVVMTANADYWGGKPSLDKVTFRAIPELATRMAMLKNGEADIVLQLSADEAPALAKEGKVQVLSVSGMRLMMFQFNLEKSGPQSDVKVRQALNYAVDKEGIVKNILNGYGKALDGQPLSKEYFGYSDKVKAYPYDPEKAKKLLADAGYGPNNPLKLTLQAPQGRYMHDKEVAQTINGMLQAVGVQTDLQILDWGVFIDKLVAKDLGQVAFWGAATEPDGGIWLGSMLKSGEPYSFWKNAQFDALVEKAASTMDKQQRVDLYAQAEQLAHDEAPVIFLYQQVDVYGVQKRVKGFTPSPDEAIQLSSISVGPKQ